MRTDITFNDDCCNGDDVTVGPVLVKNFNFETFINKWGSASFSELELNFLRDNPELLAAINSYISTNGFSNPEPDRPNLGLIGGIIRNQLNSEEEKDFFEIYWLGTAPLNSSSHWSGLEKAIILRENQFREIENDLKNARMDWRDGTMVKINGKVLKMWLITTPASSNYKLVLGNFTFYTDLSDNILTLIDTYDFNPGDRPLIPEAQTRAVNWASILYEKQNNIYKITYP